MTAAQIESAPLHPTPHQDGDSDQGRIAALLARIGLHLRAQRVELFTAEGNRQRLVAWWGTLGHEAEPTEANQEPAIGWFPWSLGNLRPQHHLFIENAATLPSSPNGPSLGSLGFESVLYLPFVTTGPLDEPGGSMCAYWTRTGVTWTPDSADDVIDWVDQALHR